MSSVAGEADVLLGRLGRLRSDAVGQDNEARSTLAKAGLGGMDALHVAAAELLRADEFITTEKPETSNINC